MTSHLQSLAVLAAAAIFAVGCAESQFPEATGKGTISALHAMPTAPEVSFLIEERSLGTISYKGALAAQPFDDLTYDFNFETRVAGEAGLTRIATESADIAVNVDHVFVITGTVADPAVLVWESDAREWDGDETVLQVSAGHLAAGSGPLDIYFEPPGTTPVAGGARGTLSFGERLTAFDVENGSWQIIVTEQNDPSAILFRSTSSTYSERSSILFTVQDADPSITSGISVRRIINGGAATEMSDVGSPPTRRFFNAAFGSGNVDVWLDDNFTTPIASDIAYGTLGAEVPVPSGESTFTFTAAGNPGAVLLETESTTPGNTRGTTFLTGEAGDLEVAAFVDDRRPVTGFAKIRLSQLSANFGIVDAYVLDAGTDIADTAPSARQLASTANSNYLHLPAGDYELTVTEAGEKTAIAGPLSFDLVAGDIVEVAIIDTADPNTVTLVEF
ncbi:MAG: DUF4397 domain-containing protein [Woeseia sp.]